MTILSSIENGKTKPLKIIQAENEIAFSENPYLSISSHFLSPGLMERIGFVSETVCDNQPRK